MVLCFWGYKGPALWNMQVLGIWKTAHFQYDQIIQLVCFVKDSLATCTKRLTAFLSEAAATVPVEKPSSSI